MGFEWLAQVGPWPSGYHTYVVPANDRATMWPITGVGCSKWLESARRPQNVLPLDAPP